MRACWRCAAPIEGAAPYVAARGSSVAVAAAPSVVHAPVSTGARRPSHRGPGFLRLAGVGLLAGAILTLAFLAFEASRPRPRTPDAASIKLHTITFERLRFQIDVPLRWSAVVDDARNVVFVDPDEPETSRALHVVVERTSLEKALAHYAKEKIDRGLEIDGRPSFHRSFISGGSVIEEWWVQRGKGTFRLEFKARGNVAEEAFALNERIARTFHEL